MATYINLLNYTADGIAKIKDSPTRVAQARALMESLGGSMKGVYLTLGRYDLVVISEAPDDETAARGLLTIAKGGAIRTETLKAFTEAEFKRIIAALP